MTQRPFPIPTWAPVAAAAAIVVWAASIWWMVATLPTGGDTSNIEEILDAVVTELESANTSIETIGDATRGGRGGARRPRRADRGPGRRGPVDSAFQMSASDAGGSDGPLDSQASSEVSDPETSPFFTDGADSYNCRHFTSMADAQEALDVNGPGDPNRIDGNKNGRAREDFKYPTAPATSPSVGTTP